MARATLPPYRAYATGPFTKAERDRVAILFGGLHWRAARALQGVFENLGYKARALPAATIEQDRLHQGATNGGGLEIDMPLTMGSLLAVLCTDVLQDLEYQVRPYEEVDPGETNRVVGESIEYLYDVFRKRPLHGKRWGTLLWHLTTDYFVDAMREVRRRFEGIEVDRLRVKPVVKITGEFYLQTVEGDANYNIHRWLESEGAEVYPAAITIWLDYWNSRLSGGEGDMLVGKAWTCPSLMDIWFRRFAACAVRT